MSSSLLYGGKQRAQLGGLALDGLLLAAQGGHALDVALSRHNLCHAHVVGVHLIHGELLLLAPAG